MGGLDPDGLRKSIQMVRQIPSVSDGCQIRRLEYRRGRDGGNWRLRLGEWQEEEWNLWAETLVPLRLL